MDLARLEHGADAVQWPVELPVRQAKNSRPPRIEMDEAEDRAQSGRLAGAVRPEKPRDRPRLDAEAEV